MFKATLKQRPIFITYCRMNSFCMGNKLIYIYLNHYECIRTIFIFWFLALFSAIKSQKQNDLTLRYQLELSFFVKQNFYQIRKYINWIGNPMWWFSWNKIFSIGERHGKLIFNLKVLNMQNILDNVFFWFTILIKDHISAKSGCSFSATEVKKNMLFNQRPLWISYRFFYTVFRVV